VPGFLRKSLHVPAESSQHVDAALNYVSLESKATALSGTCPRMVQRMGLATLLVREPQSSCWMNPASGWTRWHASGFVTPAASSQEGKTIVISSHILSELSGFCTHIAVMNGGSWYIRQRREIERQITGRQSFIVRVLREAEQAVGVIRGFEKVEFAERRR